MRIHLVILAAATLALPACGEFYGIYIPPEKPIGLSIQDGDDCLTYIDGYSANRRVRTLKIWNQNPGPPQGDSGDQVVRLTVPSGLTVSVPGVGWTVSPNGRVVEGEIKRGEELCIPVHFDNIAPNQPPTTLDVKLESFVGSTPRLEDLVSFELLTRPALMAKPVYDMLDEAGLPVEDLITHDLEKSRYESSWRQPKRQTERVTDIGAHTKTAATLDAQSLAAIAASFAPGPGSTAFTVPAATPATALPGDWLFIGMLLDDPISMAPANDAFQYVFATKLDADAANDYPTAPGFPGDTFRDTDVQFALTFDPLKGWAFRVTDSRSGMLEEVASAAWVAIRDNALLFAIPPGQFLPDAPTYLSAFRHDGTWGQQSPFDWSMDYLPLRGDEPDEPIGTPPLGP